MEKRFNVTGRCYPELHYMVDISQRLARIKEMVDQGDYFCINRGRQYGKTTTLALLKKKLETQYTVFSISFEGIGEASFESGESLAYVFMYLLNDSIEYGEVAEASEPLRNLTAESVAGEEEKLSLLKLSRLISELCIASGKPIVLMIDEVDQAGNYKAFIELLGLLRDKYLKRMERPAFQSVILSGVYDIKNLKLKIRPDETQQYNSPWNIAAEFDVDMEFSVGDIAGMLEGYEKDHHTGMDISAMAGLLYEYTSGYPFLVSRLCKIMDEKIVETKGDSEKGAAWSRGGILEAVKQLLSESNTLFDDIQKKLSDYPGMRQLLYELLYEGRGFSYHAYDGEWNIAQMFGYVKDSGGKAMVANRIFETWLYNLFVTEEQVQSAIYKEGAKDRSQFIHDGRLDMKRVLGLS